MPIAPFDGADAPQHDAVFEVLDAHALGGPSVEVVPVEVERSKAARNAVAPSNIVEDAVTATSFQQSSA